MKMIAKLTLCWIVISGMASARAELPDFVPLVKQSSPAVVNISVKSSQSSNPFTDKDLPNLPDDSPLREFFKHFFEEQQGAQEGDEGASEKRSNSVGSGFIVSEDGFIITNHHVVNNAEEIVVKLSDRREFDAKLIGSDERSDVALIKIEAEGLPSVKIGSSKELKVGEWVLAIGSPFGFEHSATAGIVSAKGRSLPSGDSNYVPFIQTDVAINPGNSGGPLFNLKGEVVGINSQIFSGTGGFMGLSFTIPIDMAMDIINQLKEKGKVSRGWLGVLIQDVDRELAESFGMDKPQGALISQVYADTPASKAGFQVGDVIIEFNGHEIERSSQLPPIVGLTPIGKAIIAKVIRQNHSIDLEVVVGELPAKDELELTQNIGESKYYKSKRLGLTLAELSSEEREKYGVEQGLLIKQLESNAVDAGLRKGDVILMISQAKMSSLQVFKTEEKTFTKGQVLPLLIKRGNAPSYIAIRVQD